MITRFMSAVAALASAVHVAGCGRGSGPAGSSTAPAAPPVASARPGGGAAGHGGSIIELGTATIGPFAVRASRDQAEITAGGDAPIDVWLTGGDIATVTAVRFWIGTEQGENFVKARADIEIPSEPNHWHTHAEVPSPLPSGAALWVEIEVGGKKHAGSFDLRAHR
jgi:hypothetical protein